MRAAKILFATNLAPEGHAASGGRSLEWATAMAAATGATLLIAHVEPGSPTAAFGSIYRGLPDPGIAETARALAAVRPTQDDVPFEHRMLRGDAAEELLKLMTEEKVDAVVVDAHPQKRLLHRLGGTLDAILHRAPCPVLICRD
jgi:nucleotide-binding universal stress UspA family protein